MSAPMHPQVAAMLADLAAAGGKAVTDCTPAEARAANRALLASASAPAPEVGSVTDRTVPGAAGEIPARHYVPGTGPGAGMLVYLHGGGWVIGDLDGHDGLCRELAVRTGYEVVNVDYRLAPEHPYPAGLDDTYAALCALAAESGERPLLVAGDSSGGNLAAACALRATRESGPAFAAQGLLYPVLDHDFATPSYVRNVAGPLVGRAEMQWYFDHYVADPAARDDPYVSPLRAADVAGVAPAVVVTAGLDPLCDEGVAYAERLTAAGVPVRHLHEAEMPHGFLSFPQYLDAARLGAAAVAAALVELAAPNRL